MKTIYRILLPALMMCAAMAATGCTEQFDVPPALVPATDADIEREGYEIVSIKSVKQIFAAQYPDYNSNSTSFNKGVLIDEESLAAAGMDEGSLLAIKGRVISTDYFGNVYRTLYLLDESELEEGEEPEAIEIKIGLTGMFADYQPGDILYVKVNGLVIGNYRFNLSLGSVFQALEGANEYANGYIDLKPEVLERIKRGTRNRDLPPLDTLVFRAGETGIFDVFDSGGRNLDPNKAKAVSSIVGRLVRFEGMTSIPGTAETGDGFAPGFSATDIYPSFLEQKGSGTFAQYMNYLFLDVIDEWKAYDAGVSDEMPVSPRPGKMFPTWAFSNDRVSYYGSALFGIGNSYFVVRSSGYSNFALEPLPFEYVISEDGDVEVAGSKDVDSVTGIVTRYSSSSGGFHKFQILLNSSRDMVYDRSNNPR